MAQTDMTSTATTALGSSDFKVSAQVLDSAQHGEYAYLNPNFSKYLGYYKTIPELKKAIDALAMWTVGRGYKADTRTKNNLRIISGWGEDTFQNIMWNMIVMKKVNGDSFSEIIRGEKGIIVNLKPMNPQTLRIVVNNKGIIIRYEQLDAVSGQINKKFEPSSILHLSNDRVGNEIHGNSVIEACQWVIDARNEAMADKRRLLHRSSIRVIEVDSDDTTKYTQLQRDYKEAIKKGEVLIVPKDTTNFPNIPPISTQEHTEWIRYLENFFYQAVGVPKIIMGGSQDFTEASSKIGYLTFEQPYISEQRELEEDLLAQLGLTIEFERPVSLKDEIKESEAANTGQVGTQPSETQAVGNV